MVYRDYIQASKKIFKNLNLSLSTRKTYSTLPQKSTKLKWEILKNLLLKFFDSVKDLSIFLEVVSNLRN